MSVDRVFLDANVLFSAAYRPNAGMVRLWVLGNVELFTSAYAIDEARTNFIDDDQQRRLSELLRDVHLSRDLAPLPFGIMLPDKDRPILQAAIHANATHLVTGDKEHFGRYFGQRIMGVLVLPPADYFVQHRRRFGEYK